LAHIINDGNGPDGGQVPVDSNTYISGATENVAGNDSTTAFHEQDNSHVDPENLGSRMAILVIYRRSARLLATALGLVHPILRRVGVNGRRIWLGRLLWVAFAAGLLVQTVFPHLKIQNNKFVIPSAVLSGGNEVHPDEMVVRERRLQALSGMLTLGGAIGLGFYYRQALFPKDRLS
jgi:hypothetical protein